MQISGINYCKFELWVHTVVIELAQLIRMKFKIAYMRIIMIKLVIIEWYCKYRFQLLSHLANYFNSFYWFRDTNITKKLLSVYFTTDLVGL